MWLKDHGIKAFFTASQNKSFSDGAISCMNLAGLGKLTPNMVLMGFKVQIWHQSVFYLCLTAKDCFSPFLLVHDSVWDALCFASGWLGVWSWGSRGVHQRDASCIWHQHGHGGTKVRLPQLCILYQGQARGIWTYHSSKFKIWLYHEGPTVQSRITQKWLELSLSFFHIMKIWDICGHL